MISIIENQHNISLSLGISARLCQNDNLGVLSNNTSNSTLQKDLVLFHCPRPEDPPHFTDCCFSGIQSSSSCCERKTQAAYVYGLDDRYILFS